MSVVKVMLLKCLSGEKFFELVDTANGLWLEMGACNLYLVVHELLVRVYALQHSSLPSEHLHGNRSVNALPKQ